MSRLRGGSAGAARGAASFLTETISRVRNAGATGQLTVRADSAFYSKKVLATAVKFDVRFSITARQDRRVRAAIDAIDEDAWQPAALPVGRTRIRGGTARPSTRAKRPTAGRVRAEPAHLPAAGRATPCQRCGRGDRHHSRFCRVAPGDSEYATSAPSTRTHGASRDYRCRRDLRRLQLTRRWVEYLPVGEPPTWGALGSTSTSSRTSALG